jgi:uncharacterized Zn finger protein
MEQQQMNISLDKTTGVSCDSCKNNVFQEGVMLRKASRFLTGTPNDALIPIPVFACTKCGHVNNEFLPPQLRTDFVEVIEDEVEEKGSTKVIQMS